MKRIPKGKHPEAGRFFPDFKGLQSNAVHDVRFPCTGFLILGRLNCHLLY
jgi:hypothetical protein